MFIPSANKACTCYRKLSLRHPDRVQGTILLGRLGGIFGLTRTCAPGVDPGAVADRYSSNPSKKFDRRPGVPRASSAECKSSWFILHS